MTIGVDIPPVENEDEALVLMLHHLKLAAAYFEATPEGDDLYDRLPADAFSLPAITAWLGAMEALYPENY